MMKTLFLTFVPSIPVTIWFRTLRLELLLDPLETTNVPPLDSGHLHDSLAQRGGVRGAEGEAEVLHRRADGVLDQVNDIHCL